MNIVHALRSNSNRFAYRHPPVLIKFRNPLHAVRVCRNKWYLPEQGNVMFNQ